MSPTGHEATRRSPRRSNFLAPSYPGFRLRHSPSTSRRYWIAGGAACVLMLACSATLGSASQAFESPTVVVRTTLEEVFRILEDEKLKAPQHLKARRRMLEGVIAQRFDYEEMSKRALAENWKPLSESERREFVELFKAFLSDRYAAKIESYSGEQVSYLGERIADGFAEVRTKLRSTKVEVEMNYRLHVKSGRWSAYDIIVDGVGLVRNYRSQFAKIVHDHSYQELVRRLRERTLVESKKSGTAG